MRQVTADALISGFKQTARENQVGQRKAQKGTADSGGAFAYAMDDSPEGWSYCFAIKGIDYSEERADGAESVPRSVLLELADACLTLENLNTFADLAAAIAALQSAAKKTTSYLKGGN